MAPININVVHRTACNEGYAGLVYRERMGKPYMGFLPMLGGIAGGLSLALFCTIPYSTSLLRLLMACSNPAKIQETRASLFAGYSSTGKSITDGVGVSATGAMKAKVHMESDYDPGIGFTMLSACVVASSIVKKLQAKDRARNGFQTAVTAVGGEALADALRAVDVKITIVKE